MTIGLGDLVPQTKTGRSSALNMVCETRGFKALSWCVCVCDSRHIRPLPTSSERKMPPQHCEIAL